MNFNSKAGLLGYLGFYWDKPVYIDGATSSLRYLLHEGNKPSGSYTGNGDATERIINTGGIGRAILIYGAGATDNYFAIVTYHGAIVKYGTTITALPSGEIVFSEGVLYIRTTNVSLNNNYATYNYQVL